MPNNIHFNRYYNTESKAHLIHPLSKIICTILFVIIICLAKSLWLNTILTVLLLINILLTNVPFKVYLKTIRSLWLVLLFMFIFNILIGVNIHSNILLIIKIIEVFLYSSIISITTNPTTITKGLEQLFTPLKYIGVPIYRLAFIITLSLKFIPDIFLLADKIRKSQSSRGIDYNKTGLKNKLVSIKSMTVPLFVFSMKQADDLADVMEVRLYDIDKKRNNSTILKWQLYDTANIIFYLLILLLTIVEEV